MTVPSPRLGVKTVTLDAGPSFIHVGIIYKAIHSDTAFQPHICLSCAKRRSAVIASLSSNLCALINDSVRMKCLPISTTVLPLYV